MKNTILVVAVCSALASCAASSTMRVSQNEMIIKTDAAPVCGSTGAARVAQKQAAIETIKAGYDRYVLVGQAANSNVNVTQMPGSYQTFGTAQMYGNTGTFQSNTVYNPGPTIVTGGHHQAIGVRMFREGEAGSQNAISARETLGPKWQEAVKKNVLTCAG